MNDHILVETTTPTREDAEKIARELVEQRLAACAQVSGPITSSYWWKGQMETTEEWRCALKTRTSRFAHVEKAIRALHPYEVPQILAVAIAKGNADYLFWLDKEIM